MLPARTRVAALAALLLPLGAGAAPSDVPAAAPPLDEPTLAALALALAVSPAPELGPGPAASGAPAEPELELETTVRAAAVVFDEAPRIQLLLAGSGAQRTRWRTTRVNLPAEIVPGVVYRDVEVRLSLAASPEQLEALLRDARALAAGIRIAPAAQAQAAAPAAEPAR